MASYTVTDVTPKIISLNVGQPFGYVPVCLMKVNDGWISSAAANDSITVPNAIMADMVSYLNTHPAVMSVGGSTDQLNGSSFSNYTYPIESTPVNNVRMYVSKTVFGRTTSINLDLFLDALNTKQTCISNRSNGRVRPIIIMCDDLGIFPCSLTGFCPDINAGSTYNSYEHVADNSGLPYGTTEGYTLYSTSDLTDTIAKKILFADLDYIEPAPPSSDPYADGGFSGDGGGDGSFDLHNDSIDFPSLPTLSAVDTGLVSIYAPSLTQLKSLATFLWNANPTDVDWWKKLVANPLDLILGLSIVPVQVPAGAAQTIKVGLIDTGVSVSKAASQFVTVDCGSVTINKNCGGSALDYSPFTKFSLYLPFIGTRTISCDDIMGRTVHVKYNVDLLSGGCTAMVKITGGPEDNQLDAILYQYSGACAISIPLTGETFTNMITSTIQLAASIGATVATGGAAAGVTAASAANSLMSMKPIIERAGGVSGAAGQLGIMKPYLIAEVPRQSVPANCNQFTGYPSNMKAVIGDLTGYTEVEIIYITGIEATQAELDELESVLKGGFII